MKRSFLLQHFDIVRADMPLVVVLDAMTKYKTNVDTVLDKICFGFLHLELELIRKEGHIYLEWNKYYQVLLTKQGITKLHRGFADPVIPVGLNNR